MKRSRILPIIFLGAMTACAEMPTGKINPGWSDEAKSAVRHRQVHIGMTQDQVVSSWGQPWRKSQSVGKDGIIEVWKYGLGEYAVHTWLVFRDGILVRTVR